MAHINYSTSVDYYRYRDVADYYWDYKFKNVLETPRTVSSNNLILILKARFNKDTVSSIIKFS